MRPFQYLAPFPSFRYLAPKSVGELLDSLEVGGEGSVVIAGGTDLMMALKERTTTPDAVIDISRLGRELGGIRKGGGALRIGALTTFAEIEASQLVDRFAEALKTAAANVGTLQIRNLATIGGNLATASPAGDSAPPLIALGACVKILSRSGERTVPVESFFRGVKKNALLRGEVVAEVALPAREGVSSAWARGAVRNENALSTVSVAVSASIANGRFGESRVALGAVAPTPMLAEKSSKLMTEGDATAEKAEEVAALAAEEARPITDIRASAAYRKRLVFVLTRRLIAGLLSEAGAA